MKAKFPEGEAWIAPLSIVALVVLFWHDSWQAGLGRADFAGHVGTIATLGDQLQAQWGLPLWTPDWNAGSSLVVEYLHPLISSFLLLPFVSQWGIISGIRIGDTFFLVLAGLSMYVWCRHLVRSRRAAFVGAVIYVLHPSVFTFVGVVGQIHQPVSMALVPLFFWSWMRLAEVPGRRSVVAAAVVSALLFYDMERFWLILPQVLIVYFVVVWTRCSRERRKVEMLRAFGLASAVGTGMVLLVAFPVLPAIFERSLLQWHDVSNIDAFRQLYSFPHLLALADRNGLIARPLDPLFAYVFASHPGQWYQGLVALLFVTGGVVLACRNFADRRDRGRLGIALLLLLSALLVSFGVHPVGPWHVALMSLASDQPLGGLLVSLMVLLAAVVAVFLGASAWLISRVIAESWPQRRGLGIGVTIVLLVAFLFARPFVWLAHTLFIYAHVRAPSHFAFPAIPFLLGTAACLVTPVWTRFVGTQRATLLVVALVVLHAIDVNPYRYREDWVYPEAIVDEWVDAWSRLDDHEPGRMLDTHRYNPVADMLSVTVARRDLAWGWLGWSSTKYLGDVIKTGFFDSLHLAAENSGSQNASSTSRDDLIRTAAELSSLANVRFVSRIVGISPPLPPSPYFRMAVGNRRVEIFESRDVLPYVQFYPEVALLSGSIDEILPRVGGLAQEGVASLTLAEGMDVPAVPIDYWHGVRAESLAPEGAARLNAGRPFRPGPPGTGRRDPQPCQILARAPDSIRLDCNFARAGVLVIAEAWFPDWRVSVDGAVGLPLRVNHAFQGVAVTPGPARIAFEHRASAATRVGVVISALSWLAILGLWFFLPPDRRT